MRALPGDSHAGLMPNRRGMERTLVGGIRTGAALVLLTPLIVTPATAFPFVVGKALYSRAAIEVVFGLYVVLAAVRPAYAPPRRSRLLLLLTASLAAAVAAAVLGVSPRRSLWSDYVWMQGVIDAAHWFAFTVVIAATFRTARDWRALLRVNAGVGAVIALLAVASSYAVDVPFFGDLPEHYYPKIATVFGNPLYLGAYLLVNAVVTGGLLMRSVLDRGGGPRVWPRRLLWGVAAALHLWAFTLAGSLGAFVGLVAAVAFLGGAYLFLAPGRAARGAGAAAAVLAGGAVLLVVFAGDLPGRFIDSSGNPLLARIDHLTTPSTLENRLASWRAGLAGFAERPLLGWGPDNFRVVFGRHAAGDGDSNIVYVAYAHGKLVEKAATKGLAGVVTYLATSAWALFVMVRAGRRAAAGDRALILFAGAALAGAFVQIQTLFDHSASSLQYALLFGFGAHLELRGPAAARPAARRRGGGGVLMALCARPQARAAAALGALVLVGAGLAANRAIYSAAVELRRSYAAEHEEAAARRAIDAFEPLANLPRLLWFLSLADRWPELHARDPAAAKETLARAGAEAAAALAAEPENWRIHQALAVLYSAAAATAPEYLADAERFLRQALALAPNLYRFAPSGWMR